MKALRRVMGGLRSLFWRNREEQELDEELRGYLDMSAEHKMSAGMSSDDAMRSARVEFGSLDSVKEQVRDVGWESFLETLWQDIRFAVRTLMKEPSFTAWRTAACSSSKRLASYNYPSGSATRPASWQRPFCRGWMRFSWIQPFSPSRWDYRF